jgi:hypothetical protein
MSSHHWTVTDRWMRGLHLYTSLFLVPWMVVYAISAFCLNHNRWFQERKLTPTFVVLSETDFVADAAFPHDPTEQAQALLRHLGLDGAHRVASTDANQLTLYRSSLTGMYRITWHTQRTRLKVEKQQPFSAYSFLNSVHFQHEYQAGYWAPSLWAATVDAVTGSTLLWVVSGIYLWARRPRRRLAGGLCLAAGGLVFLVLVILLCR